MDIINIFTGIVLVLSMSANMQGAKKGLKTSITKAVERPATWLQKTPVTVSAIIFLLIVLGIFNVGTFPFAYEPYVQPYRIAGLAMFIIFSWLQVVSYKSLKDFYSQDIVILKQHELTTSGMYKYIRHPQYTSQILSDLGAGLALMNFLVIPAVLAAELVLFYLRAKKEEALLKKYFGDEYTEYKKHTGFFIPYLG